MKTLSSLDAAFLYLETPEMPMHVGALHVFELPAGYKGRYVRDLRRHIAARLAIVPALRRRLWWMPLNLANPAWVDAEPDLNRHIVEIRLPKSARHGDGMAALEAQVAALHPVLLDRSKPLWKFHVFEGLAPGANGQKRVALYSQLHHAAVDGQAAVALANAILDLTPEPRAIELKPGSRTKTFRLSMGESLRGALANPMPWAIALGGALGALGWRPAGPVDAVVKMLADAASPVALFTIGAVLWRAGQHAHTRTARKRYVPLALAKLLLHPALVFAVAIGARAAGAPLTELQLMAITLTAALPSAANVAMLAERFGADNGRIARIIMTSTVLSFVTFTSLAWWFGAKA
jgi:hypothetical protein